VTPFDLHALGTPPALILSQDQTLHQIFTQPLHGGGTPGHPGCQALTEIRPRPDRGLVCCCSCCAALSTEDDAFSFSLLPLQRRTTRPTVPVPHTAPSLVPEIRDRYATQGPPGGSTLTCQGAEPSCALGVLRSFQGNLISLPDRGRSVKERFSCVRRHPPFPRAVFAATAFLPYRADCVKRFRGAFRFDRLIGFFRTAPAARENIAMPQQRCQGDFGAIVAIVHHSDFAPRNYPLPGENQDRATRATFLYFPCYVHSAPHAWMPLSPQE
jgi:hypothetical protein